MTGHWIAAMWKTKQQIRSGSASSAIKDYEKTGSKVRFFLCNLYTNLILKIHNNYTINVYANFIVSDNF